MAASTDTIVALATPPGRSPRGMIRLSGPQAADILVALDVDSSLPWPRHLVRARLRVGSGLPCLRVFFPAPHSYTGQDMAEVQLPGQPALLERVIRAALDNGARLANPGEFTFLAFKNGKLDLTQAEGVAATIAAISDSQLQAAGELRRGRLGQLVMKLVDDLSLSLARVEAGIDFVDQDDVVPIGPDALGRQVSLAAGQLDDLLSHSRRWATLNALPRVVLAGPANAGKSTLFNALLGRPRALTSDRPGTTRDVLAEPLRLERAGGDGVEVMLVDVAGLDEPLQALDHQVQAAAREAMEQADLLLLVDDGRAMPMVTKVSAERPSLRVRTKADLPPRPDPAWAQVVVSVQQGQGIVALRERITQCIGGDGVSLQAGMMALQPRHEQSLRLAAGHLQAAAELLAPQGQNRSLNHAELIACALRWALDELACLGGQMTPDDVIGKVFATFCVGK